MTTTQNVPATAPWRVPGARERDAFEERYDRYLSRTRADWLALISLILIARLKIPSVLELSAAWLPPLVKLPILIGPSLAVILGFTISGDDFRSILRGRSSWRSALTWAFVTGTVGFSAHTLLIVAVGKTVTEPFTRDSGLAAQVFVLVVLAPIVEEYLFQAVLQTRLARWGSIASILTTTLAFTLFHLDVFDRLPTPNELFNQIPLFFGLLGFAIMRNCNGSFAGLVVSHALSNVLAIQFDHYFARHP